MNTPPPSRRPSWRTSIGGVALAVLLSVFVAACGRSLTYRTHAVGHDISARIEGNTRSIETQPTYAMIRGGSGAVTIERERVRIDHNPWTAIPAGVAVEVTIRAGRVRVIAGHVTIERTVSG